jgi:hypothetical protein
MLSRKERTANTKAELALVTEEKQRLKRHQDELKRRLKQAILGGSVFFRGNDRSPDEQATDVGKTASKLLDLVLPEVFDRFAEAAARIQKKDLESLLLGENLHGLTPVFAQLGLIRDAKGKIVFNIESGPLAEIFTRIENQYSYGIASTGKSLADEFAKEPFGWEFDAVRLFLVALVRSGKIEATSKGQTIDSALSIEARNTFENNNLFRQTSFRPKKGVEFEDLVTAAEAFKLTFGKDLPELEQVAAAGAIREEAGRQEHALHEMHTRLLTNHLPGSDVIGKALDQLRSIRSGSEESAIVAFNGCHSELKDALDVSAGRVRPERGNPRCGNPPRRYPETRDVFPGVTGHRPRGPSAREGLCGPLRSRRR